MKNMIKVRKKIYLDIPVLVKGSELFSVSWVVSCFGFTQSPQRSNERNVASPLRSERCEKY